MKNLGFFRNYFCFPTIFITSFFFQENCQTIKKPETPNFIERIENTGFFQKTKINPSQEFTYEKSSNRIKYFTLQKKDSNWEAKLVQISIYAYNNQFLEKVVENFPRSQLQKYSLVESVKTGKAILSPQDKTVQVSFQTEESRMVNGNDVLEAIDSLISLPYKKGAPLTEEVKFSLREDGNLWKKEETLENQTRQKFIWKNHEEGGIIKKFAFTEFQENNTEKRISKISDEKEFIFKRIDSSDANKPYKLFQNQEYAIYYFPGDNFKLEYTNIVAMENFKKQLTLYKNKFPILVFKKSFN
jgi:hypothetical protein